MGRFLTGLLVIVLTFAVSASAGAATRHVAKTGSDSSDCTSSASPCATVGYAVGQAAGGDTIQIGPGTYVEGVITDKTLTFVGAGSAGLPSAQTTIQGPTGSSGLAGKPALSLSSGGTVRSLRAQGGIGGSAVSNFGELGGDAIVFDSGGPAPASLRLEDVMAIGGNGSPGTLGPGPAGTGIDVDDAPGPVSLSVTDSEARGGVGLGNGGGIWIDGTTASALIANSRLPNLDSFGDALFVTGGAQTTVVESSLSAEFVVSMYGGRLDIIRSRLQSEGSAVYVTPSTEEISNVSLVDSLLVSDQTSAIYVTTEEQSSATVSAIGTTLIGHGTEAVSATQPEGAGPAKVILRNSVARVFPPPGYPLPTSDLFADGGTIESTFSSFLTTRQENGGSVAPPGSGSNVAADPLFADPASGSYSLQATSPLIDRGDPSLVIAGQTDLVGNPRALDGNLDCVVAPDIGAYEVTGRGTACAADAPPVISQFGMKNRVFAPKGARKPHRRRASASSARRGKKRTKRGTRFTFTLSEPAQVTIRVKQAKRDRRALEDLTSTCGEHRGGKCPKLARGARLGASRAAGRGSIAFSGRSKGRALEPGRYVATIDAVDAAGQGSEPRRLRFRIVGG